MNDYLGSVIYKRRSVRKYAEGAIKPEHLDHILRAAMAAPSAHNCQPWSFVVIDDRALLDAFADMHPYGKMLYKAPAVIMACTKREVASINPYYQQDMGASIQNMLLAATECGVASCWCGIHPYATDIEKKFAEMLNMPDTLFPFALVSLGNMEGESRPSNRFDPSRVQHNAW